MLGGHDRCLNLLIEAGCNVKSADSSGTTPVHWAAANGHVACLCILRDAGCDLGVRDEDGNTPVWFAAFYGHEDVLSVLIAARVEAASECGGTVFSQGGTPLKAADESGNDVCADMIRVYLKPRPRKSAGLGIGP